MPVLFLHTGVHDQWHAPTDDAELNDHKVRLPDRLGAIWQRQADSSYGVRISRTGSRSPAARANIRPGDRIVQFAGHEISNSEQLASVVMLAGHEVPVVVRRPRRTEPVQLTVELDGNPMRLGITWRTDEAEPGTVILTHVVPGSPAAEAELQAGDRIYRAAGQNFADEPAFLELVKTPGDVLTLLIERDGQLRTVVVQLPVDAAQRAA
ncbi:MAG: PDZ domain-containing protein [Candidatus Nealsonbacteria bacterium]|nr:PDZ domain-containing protein [Candidatus Nealsonbacteria bacterium]